MGNDSGPILSICIPTCKRPEIMETTLNSIYSENINKDEFNVCISDNSKTNETQELIAKKFADKENLIYRKSDCEGFMNSIEALKLGTGKMLKLHNDYSMFNQGDLEKMIERVSLYDDTDSVLFFSMGALKNKKSVVEETTFNDFLNNVSYYSTWSTSFAIWKKDFELIENKKIDYNYMFPHTSILFEMYDKKKYIVDNYRYTIGQKPKKKGGYNLVNNFAVIYIDMVKSLMDNKLIENNTLKKIKNGIIKFVGMWYAITNNEKEVYTFSFEDKNELIKKNYGNCGVAKFYFFYFLYNLKFKIKKIIKKLGLISDNK